MTHIASLSFASDRFARECRRQRRADLGAIILSRAATGLLVFTFSMSGLQMARLALGAAVEMPGLIQSDTPRW
jgi:hypothetical protein